MYQVLGVVHDSTGFPWWMTIVLVTVSTRLCILPFAAIQQQVAARMQKAAPLLQSVEQEYQVAQKIYNDPGAKMRRDLKMAEIYATHQCQPWKLFAFVVLQAPLFISYFFAVKGLAARFPDFVAGGTLWFADLSASDPFFLLPVAAGLSLMSVLEVSRRTMAMITTTVYHRPLDPVHESSPIPAHRNPSMCSLIVRPSVLTCCRRSGMSVLELRRCL